MKVLRIDHIAIASRDARPGLQALARLGLTPADEQSFPALDAKRTSYRIAGVELELLQGGPATPIIGPWLDQHGDGLCHVCLEVDDLDGALAELASSGVTTIAGVQLSRGRRTAFLEPATTANVMFELVETTDARTGQPG